MTALLKRSFLLLLALWLAGVSLRQSDAATAPAIKAAKLIVQPSVIELRGAQSDHGFIVTAVTADGSMFDVTARSKFSS